MIKWKDKTSFYRSKGSKMKWRSLEIEKDFRVIKDWITDEKEALFAAAD